MVQHQPGLAGRQPQAFGFVEGKDAAGPHYWFQTDIRPGKIWAPQYAALEIIGPDGDAVAGQDYHFDFVLNTFDPTSPYYPASVTYSWLNSHRHAGRGSAQRTLPPG